MPFEAGREYAAIDFLPPSLQGLVNKDVDAPKAIELRGTKGLREMREGNFNIGITPNCHGTAWEAMRSFQGQTEGAHALFYGDGTTADAKYDLPGAFTQVGASKPQAGVPDFVKELKAGDLVTFHEHLEGIGNSTLLHSAVYAGGGLFFEKPDTEDDSYSETPYRLVTYDQMKAPIVEYLGAEPAASGKRPAQPLDTGMAAFSTPDEANIEKWAKKHGTTIGKPLVIELEIGMGGGTRGMHVSAVDTHKVKIGADGRGIVE